MVPIDQQTDALPSALEASGFVGTWTRDIAADRIVLDAQAAELLTGSADLAGVSLTLERAMASLHPDDVARLRAVFVRQGRVAGPTAFEYRVRAPTGEYRWILDRGRIYRDPDGSMHGRGALIDVTDTRLTTVDDPDEALTRAVDKCLSARDDLRRSRSLLAVPLMDLLLLELGREIARGMKKP